MWIWYYFCKRLMSNDIISPKHLCIWAYTLFLQEKKWVNAHQFVNVFCREKEMIMLWIISLIFKYNFILFYWFRRGYVTFSIQKREKKKICNWGHFKMFNFQSMFQGITFDGKFKEFSFQISLWIWGKKKTKQKNSIFFSKLFITWLNFTCDVNFWDDCFTHRIAWIFWQAGISQGTTAL